MAIARFYLKSISQGLNELSEDEARHAAGAKRMRVGESVALFDGMGGSAFGEIVEVSSRKVTVNAERTKFQEKPKPKIEVAVAVPKGKRLQFMVEKLTELGVDRITPVIFNRSVAEGGGDPTKKWSRWAIEAAKQSGRCWLPDISAPVKLSDFLQAKPSTLYLADDKGDSACKVLDSEQDSFSCLFGPEGGLSEDEFALCESHGCIKISLGRNILRIETAAIAYCAAVNAITL